MHSIGKINKCIIEELIVITIPRQGEGGIYIFLIADCNIQCKSRDIIIFVKKNLCMNPHSVKDAT